ncbi:MAG: hypothetical protein ACI4WG_03585 [Erysipelotrichaceae bacterium]
MFTEKQMEMLKKLKIQINPYNPTDEEIFQMEEKLSDYIQRKGFDKDYNPTEECLICESILDLIGEVF